MSANRWSRSRWSSEGRTLRDSSILELVETEVGLPLSMRQVRESVTHLFSLGTFEDVRVAGGQLEHGVSLRYQLVPSPSSDGSSSRVTPPSPPMIYEPRLLRCTGCSSKPASASSTRFAVCTDPAGSFDLR